MYTYLWKEKFLINIKNSLRTYFDQQSEHFQGNNIQAL